MCNLIYLRFVWTCLALAMAFCTGHSCSGAIVSFDSSSQFSNEFQLLNGIGNLAASSSGGVSGGAVAVANTLESDIAKFITETFTLNPGLRLHTSIDWYFDPIRNNPFAATSVVAIGFGRADSDVNFLTAASIFLIDRPNALITDGTIVLNAQSQGAGPNFATPTTLGWYRTQLGVDSLGGPFDAFELSTRTYSLGIDGLQTPTLLPGSAVSQASSSMVINGVPLRGGFAATGFGGVAFLDNYSVELTAIPEPSSLMLFGMPFATVQLLRRRRALTSARVLLTTMQ